jgi:glycosyltransferase involved in cell wall biosynthesis
MLRIYLKYNDYVNTRLAKNIIVNSYFSYSNLKKIYNKKGIVIYPGLVKKKPTKINIYNKDKIIIVGQLSYTKGYDHALKLIAQSGNKIVTVIGRKTEDYKNIVKISKHYGVTINLVTTDNDYIKNKLYKKHGIFIACQRNEPFGITTAEACYNNLVVFGLNKGGTSEIVSHGLNGFLYEENSLKTASECLKKFQSQRRPTITKINSIDWKQMSNKMISIFNE